MSTTGVVSAVRSEQRMATVLTDDGRIVEVHGGSTRAMSSVDRTYRAGGRYEFHPVDSSSPFEDNACTAARLLSMGPVPPSAPVSSTGEPSAAVPVAGAVAGLLTLALVAAIWRPRGRRLSGAGRHPG